MNTSGGFILVVVAMILAVVAPVVEVEDTGGRRGGRRLSHIPVLETGPHPRVRTIGI